VLGEDPSEQERHHNQPLHRDGLKETVLVARRSHIALREHHHTLEDAQACVPRAQRSHWTPSTLRTAPLRISLNDHANALADCKTAIRLDPKYRKAYTRKGQSHAALRQFQEAMDAHEEALCLEPGSVDAQQALDLARAEL
jgi:tetratricopeptide (TPR) repeat protein